MTKNAYLFQVTSVDVNTSFIYNSTYATEAIVSLPANILRQAASTEKSGSYILIAIVEYFNDTLFQSSENVSYVSAKNFALFYELSSIMSMQLTYKYIFEKCITIKCFLWYIYQDCLNRCRKEQLVVSISPSP